MQNVLSQLTLIDYFIGVILLIILISIFIYRESKYVIRIVGDAIVEAEKKLNSSSGQERLDFAVERIKQQLPYILKPFMTKRILVSIIEFMLNFINEAFKTGKIVDIQGNDDEQ